VPFELLSAANQVLNRTEKFPDDEKNRDGLVDVTKLSTPLLEMLVAELEEIQRRESQAKAALPFPMQRKA
jgi:hypothetical protein